MGYYSQEKKSIEVPAPAGYVFEILLEVLKTMDGITIEKSLGEEGLIQASRGINFCTWGEQILITATPTTPDCCQVTITSTAKAPPIDVGYAFDLFGKNKANIEEILSSTRRILEARPYFVPDATMIETASAQSERITALKEAGHQRGIVEGGADYPPVYICYVPEDNDTAEGLCATLESRGIPCWISPRDVAAMQGVRNPESAGLDTCDRMVLVFSSHANRSEEVTEQLSRAVARGIEVIFFRTEEVEMAREIRCLIGEPTWINAVTSDSDEGYSRLISRIGP
ncbi:toll/interleukin-1 receptor domain-containing protein [Methanofollis formosanus]|nr:toll/interleukin-1 receptor domain-containing protein [Methanofollis formosanus]